MLAELLEARRLFALSVSIDQGVLLVKGTDAGDVIAVDMADGGLSVKVNAAAFTLPAKEVKSISVQAGGGDDKVTVTDNVNKPLLLAGGEGNDLLRGGKKAARISGDTGHDTLGGGAGSDTFVGGPGLDTVDYANRTDALVITLDGKPNDGRPAAKGLKAEKDNVAADIENVAGGSGNDAITGSATRNTLKGGPGNDTLNGAGGDDLLAGGPGADKLFGGDGDDVLLAIDSATTDALDGGPGFDSAAYDDVVGATDALLNLEDALSILSV